MTAPSKEKADRIPLSGGWYYGPVPSGPCLQLFDPNGFIVHTTSPPLEVARKHAASLSASPAGAGSDVAEVERRARNKALEEAAKVAYDEGACRDDDGEHADAWVAVQIARKLRALIQQPAAERAVARTDKALLDEYWNAMRRWHFLPLGSVDLRAAEDALNAARAALEARLSAPPTCKESLHVEPALSAAHQQGTGEVDHIPRLLPCPFCGSHSIDPEGWMSEHCKGPECDDCGSTAQSVELWNLRPDTTTSDVHHHPDNSPGFQAGFALARALQARFATPAQVQAAPDERAEADRKIGEVIRTAWEAAQGYLDPDGSIEVRLAEDSPLVAIVYAAPLPPIPADADGGGR